MEKKIMPILNRKTHVYLEKIMFMKSFRAQLIEIKKNAYNYVIGQD